MQKAEEKFLRWCQAGKFSDKATKLLREPGCDPSAIRNSVAKEADEDVWWTPVHYAVKNGELNFLKFLVNECGCDPAEEYTRNIWWSPLETPLHTACRYGHLSIVKYLVTSCKCSPESKDSENRSPLHSATAHGYEDIVKFLMGNFNCDPLCRDSKGQTPLYIAATLEQTDVSMYMSSVLGCTPLHVACEKGDCQEVSRLLISDDPEMVHERDKDGKTPLHYACTSAAITGISIVDELLNTEICIPNLIDCQGKTAFVSAIECGHYERFRRILLNGICNPNTIIDNEGRTAFIVACYKEDYIVVAKLLQAGRTFDTNLNAADKKGRTALHYLCCRNSHDSLDALDLLLRNRECDPNVIDNDGTTPLHVALVHQNYPALQALLRNGKCDPNTIMTNKSFTISREDNTSSGSGRDLMTPLCFSYKVGDNMAMALLLHMSIDQSHVNFQYRDGKTLLHYACEDSIPVKRKYKVPVNVARDHFEPLLVNGIQQSSFSTQFRWSSAPSYHTDISNDVANSEKALYLLLSSSKCRVNIQDKYGRTPLHLACMHNYILKTKVLIEHESCDPSIRDNRNRTPLYIAMALHHYPILSVLLQSTKCDGKVTIRGKDYVEPHLNCTFDNHDLVTPLHLAIKADDYSAVILILRDKRCLINAQDKDGKTPLHYACDNFIESLDASYEEGLVYANKVARTRTKSSSLTVWPHVDATIPFNNMRESGRESMWYSMPMVNSSKVQITDTYQQTVATILENEACNPNISDNEYKTPLYIAMSLRNYDALRLLLQSDKCDPNTIITGKGCSAPHADCSYENCDLETSLHYACRTGYVEAVSLLLQNDKCQVNARDKDGKTAFHYACATESNEVIRMLVVCNSCKLNLTDNEEKAPLQLVLDKRNYQIAKFLLQSQRCDPFPFNGEGECYTSLHLACEMGDYKLVLQLLCDKKYQLILNSKDDNGKSALHYTCKEIGPNYTEIAMLLLADKNCNRNITDRNGRTPLHYACVCKASLVVEALVDDDACKLNICDDYGKVPLQIALEENDNETIRILILTWKCDLAELIKLYTEWTPLHYACKIANLEIISLLTSSNKYLIDLQDSLGRTPLHYICGDKGSNALLEAKLLLESGCCNVNIRDNEGKTALCEAMESKNYGVFKLLLLSGKCDLTLTVNSCDCSILHVACDTGDFEAVALLIANFECLMNIQDMHGKTALHYICWKNLKNTKKIITYMLKRGCDPSVADYSHKTPLFVALYTHNYVAVESLLQCEKCDPNVLYKRIVCCAPHIACNEDNCALFTPLHFACRRGDYKAITILLNNTKCRINAQDSEDCTPLHYCCLKGDQQAVELLLSNCDCNPNLRNNQGLYPLQLAFQSLLEVYRVLLLSGKCDYNIVIDGEGRMPIHIACENGDMQVLLHLLSCGKCVTTAHDLKQRTPLHFACRRGDYKVITIILNNTKCRFNAQDSEGCTPLHYCCINGDQQGVELLLSNSNCNPNLRNNQGLYPLQLAFQSLLEVYRVLLLSGKCDCNIVIDGEGRMPIHIACENGDMQVLSYLLSFGKCITTAHDLKGKTALHYACIAANIEVVRMLLISAKSDPTLTDNDGKTPVDYTNKSYDILRQLFKHGANPSAMYHRFVLRKVIPESPVKVFVVGDGGSGKSTLVESLQRESLLARTRSVESQTAGIVPNDFKSREYGQVTLFDFAGQKQFYGTHEAFLNSAIGSYPPIFVLVLDMSAKKSLQTNLLYWQTFLQNSCAHLIIKPHLIVIGSHIDVLRESQEDPQMKFAVIDHVMSSTSASWCEFVGVVGIDCRQPRSNQMSILRRILKISCDKLRIKTVLDFNCHCCFVYLLHKFQSSPAITLAMIIAEIQAEPESAKTSDGYLNFIPETNYHLCQVLEKLNDRGHIIFIKNNSELENSWVVIDRTALFNKISGAIFAPKDFKENFDISTNTGVVPLSKIKGKFFPEYDTDLLISFLSHMEYCHEVTDRETLQLLMTEQQSSKDERYFLFPSLVTVDAPKSVWSSKAYDDNVFKFGFLMKCQGPHQFFTPRFLQVLILRLAFGYAISPDIQSDNTPQLTEMNINPIHLSVLKRKCQVWKNGIFWGTKQGIECLVSISDDDQTLILLMKSKIFSSNCLQYRSTILKKIRSIKEELTRLKVTEYIIDPNDTQYPLILERDLSMTTLEEIIKVIVECNEAAVAPTGRVLTIDHLLTFEPYAKLGKGILKQMFSSQSQHKVPDPFMTQLASQWVNKKPTVISLFNPDPILLSGKIREMNIPGPASEILCTLQLWRDIDGGNEGTYKCLREKLDQFSICCGINPLEIASSSSSDSSAVCCWCDENTVVSSKHSTSLSGKYLWKHLYSLTRIMHTDF